MKCHGEKQQQGAERDDDGDQAGRGSGRNSEVRVGKGIIECHRVFGWGSPL